MTSSHTESAWIDCEKQLPPDETPVLAVLCGVDTPRIVELRWERPTWEETFQPFQYWDDPLNEGSDIEWTEVVCWMPLPEMPKAALTDDRSDV